MFLCCNPARPLGVSRALRARNPQKSPRESPWAFRPRSRKSVRNSLKTVSGVSKQCLLTPEPVLRLFGHFFDPGAGRPRETLSETLGGSGPEGPGRLLQGAGGAAISVPFPFLKREIEVGAWNRLRVWMHSFFFTSGQTDSVCGIFQYPSPQANLKHGRFARRFANHI